MNQEKYIGMDVHQATISVAVRDSSGKLIMECILETKAATILEFIAGLRIKRRKKYDEFVAGITPVSPREQRHPLMHCLQILRHQVSVSPRHL
jgi:hypothetical protein